MGIHSVILADERLSEAGVWRVQSHLGFVVVPPVSWVRLPLLYLGRNFG